MKECLSLQVMLTISLPNNTVQYNAVYKMFLNDLICQEVQSMFSLFIALDFA